MTNRCPPVTPQPFGHCVAGPAVRPSEHVGVWGPCRRGSRGPMKEKLCVAGASEDGGAAACQLLSDGRAAEEGSGGGQPQASVP
ncbi:unnamed protein product [Lota lota]